MANIVEIEKGGTTYKLRDDSITKVAYFVLPGTYASKSAARTAAFNTYSLPFSKGMILRYFLTSGEEVVEKSTNDTASSLDANWTWGYNPDMMVASNFVLAGTYATTAAARSAAVQTYKLPLRKGSSLHYFLTDGTEVVEFSKTDTISSLDSAWESLRDYTKAFCDGVFESNGFWEAGTTFTSKADARVWLNNNGGDKYLKIGDVYKYTLNGVVRYDKFVYPPLSSSDISWKPVNCYTVSGTFTTAQAARQAAIDENGNHLFVDDIIVYTLNSATKQERVIGYPITKFDDCWMQFPYSTKDEFGKELCRTSLEGEWFSNVADTFANRAAARIYFANNRYHITIGTVLHYFLTGNIEVIEKNVTGIVSSQDSDWADYPWVTQTDHPQKASEQFMNSIDRDTKYLVRVGFVGDSLIANNIGGNIPEALDEGNTCRPMRLLTNNVPRRFYDYVSWNKPIWRRLDNADWAKSGFTTFDATALFQGTQEVYYRATTSGSYIEITVPDGYEHFALMYRTVTGNGNLAVTLNGGAIGTYTNPYYTSKVATNTIVNASVVPSVLPRGVSTIETGHSETERGNVYAISEFNNLPAGNNVLRFTTTNNSPVEVWGGFYWSGNSMVVVNCAHGGWDTSMLRSGCLPDEVVGADFDCIVFEITEMNNLRLTISQTLSDLAYITNLLSDKDILYTSCNPLGLSIEHDINFYTSELIDGQVYPRTGPFMLEVNDTVAQYMASNGLMFVDLFKYFTENVENRGGTLEGGECGLWYTWDGQHGNPAGVKFWFDRLKSVIKDKPIMLE